MSHPDPRHDPQEAVPTVECDACDWRGTNADLNEATRLWERVDENGPMPSGECPSCGALAYLIDETMDDV
jgi:hypothetical protein